MRRPPLISYSIHKSRKKVKGGLLPFSASRLPSDDRQEVAGVPLRFSPLPDGAMCKKIEIRVDKPQSRTYNLP